MGDGLEPRYGFITAASDGSATAQDLVSAIRDFLAQIDPQTGFVGC